MFLALVLGALVTLAGACSSGSDSGGRAGSSRPSPGSPPTGGTPTTTTTTPTTRPPGSQGGAPADDVLEVTGDTVADAMVEVSFTDGRAPMRVDTDANGHFDFTVSELREGENAMSFAARPPGQPGGATDLEARFTIRRGGSFTSSSVTCSGAIEVTLNIDNAPDLRVQC